MGISVNGPSGIDTQYIIESLVELERGKVTAVENQKKAYQLKIDGYSKLKTLLGDIGTKASGLSKIASFDLFKTTSSNEKSVSVTAGSGSVDGNYDLKVFQLASNEKMISADKAVISQSLSLESLGFDIGTISVDGAEIEIDTDDTIQDLRQKINSATDENGARINVSASVLKIADDNFRLVLTSKKSGAEGIAYQDIDGSLLQGLGIITDPAGNKGTSSQSVTFDGAAALVSSWDTLAEGTSVTITGKDHAGKAVSASVIKHNGDDLLVKVEEAFNGTVDATINGTDQLVLQDRISGSSQFSITDIAIGGTSHAPASTTYGDEGAGVLSVGRDAFFSVENIYMSNSSNTATGFVNGVTFNFHSVSEESVSVSLERDNDAIRTKFQEMIDAYNAILRFSKANTKVADPNDPNAKNGTLAGDSTIRTIASQINNFFHQEFDELNTVYTSFNSLGVKTNTQTGELQVENEKFDKALTERFDEVMNLFVTAGTSNNNSIVLGSSSKDTKSGKYILEEVDSQHFRARLDTGTTWYNSSVRTGSIISFDEGPLKGLSLTAPEGSIGVGNTANFTMSKGLSGIIDDAVKGLTDSHDGLVALRSESYTKRISRADDKILQLEERIEKYRIRLVNQFSAMEQALSKMQAQSSNMMSQLGSSSSSNK